MADNFWGIGNCLFWNKGTNYQLGWPLPLPPSRVVAHESHVQFRIGIVPPPFGLPYTYDMLFSDICVVRKHHSLVNYFTFIGKVGDNGFRLAFMPYSSRRFEKMVDAKLPLIEVEFVNSMWDSKEDDDRKMFNFPNRPSG